jgi:hypothetical protein
MQSIMAAKELGIFIILANYMDLNVFKKDMILFGDISILDFDTSLFEDLHASLIGNEEYDL